MHIFSVSTTLANAILNSLLFFDAAVLSTCSNVHAHLSGSIFVDALLSCDPQKVLNVYFFNFIPWDEL